MIGIPALIFYSLFRGRVQKYIAELEAAATHLMALLHSQVERQTELGKEADDLQLGRGERKDLQGL